MVNEEIVGGIKNALEHGDSLKDAMMSFFNAGYDRKEIEEAAATLLNYSTAVKVETKGPLSEIKQVEIQTPKVIQIVSSYGEEVQPKEQKETPKPIPDVIMSDNLKFVSKEIPKTIINSIPQTTSNKMEMPVQKKVSSSAMTSQEKVIVAILIGLLIFLIGILITIFLFKQQLIDFISNIMS
ncbi:hypothetical protein M0R72_04540 [Candidatus Pacearchaeota archaeon]|jgi:hypothetical protein|nr:hypothetical protein [Candidatus Pacearchaeota archaeon]